MSVHELIIVIAMVGYAVYKQTQRHEIVGDTRFKLAVIYGVIGLLVGGYHLPASSLEWVFLVASLALSVVIGLIRGRYTRVWAEGGRVWGQGTAFTVSIFLAMVVAKFALGTVAYFNGVSDSGGLGEILLMIAIMVAFQAQLVWRRAEPLGARRSSHDPAPPAPHPSVSPRP